MEQVAHSSSSQSRSANVTPDYDSVSTYLPSVVLTLWLSAHAGASCWLADDKWLSHLLVLSFAINWWFTPRATGHWNLVRYGVGVWLSWIAYGEVLHCDGTRGPDSKLSLSHMTANFLFVCSGCIATVTSNKSQYLAFATALFVTGLMVPNAESSFVKCSCAARVIKASCFSLLHSYMYLCRDREHGRLEKHFQAVTLSSGWVLVAHHHLLCVAPFQCLYTAYQRGDLGKLASDNLLFENSTLENDDVEDPNSYPADNAEMDPVSAATARALQTTSDMGHASNIRSSDTSSGSQASVSEEHLQMLRNKAAGTSTWRGLTTSSYQSKDAPVNLVNSTKGVDVDYLKALASGSGSATDRGH